ncbi:hypothetical protein CQW23_13455 [Capsicum baccatum]|uniref:Uncharacterized protein n=1 Tax=Capsicum baccatum TaxID=33114 RepID=A0A2G2WVJ1_CAPBA|nr:hypothetical protein CQW23_13455 [Capsicum baccatum]
MDVEVNDEFSLIDISSENDNLIGNSSSPIPSWNLDDYPSSGATNIQEEMGMACKGNNDEQFSQLHESKEPEKARRKGKVNLRKSLAWDSAFFTDAGVLDADELSSIMKGGDKQTLPMIEEDVRQSVDSISTLESDNLTLEHFEAELFGDIRASIQKVTIPTSGDVSVKTDNGANSSAKKVDLASKDKMKPKLAPKRIIGAQAGIPKSQPKQITGIQRLGKGLNQDKAQVTQACNLTTSGAALKPPKISTKLQPPPSKRASLDITRVKTDNDSMKSNTASVRGAQTPKAPVLNKASRVLPKPSVSMKPSSVGSSPAMKMHSKRSSSDSSGSTSSDKTVKSSIPVARRQVDTSKPIAQPSASAKLKTPSKAGVKSKLPSENSAVSAYLMASKINASISPASSISEWSSVSSSSSATINQRSSKLRTSFDTSSCRSFDSDTSTLDLKNHLSDQTSDKPEIRGTTIPRESLKQAGTVSRPASMMKPTGLRMPSPKIGYFDGVKAVRTPNGTYSNSSTALSKTETTICSPKVNSNTKAKSVKVPVRAIRKPETLKHLSPLSSSDKSSISDDHSGAQSISATALPKTQVTICSPKGNSSAKAKSVRVPLRANRKPETLKHLSPVSSLDQSNVSDNHTGGPSDVSLISEVSLGVHDEITGINASKNMDVLVEEPDPFEHIHSVGSVTSLVATKGENQGLASALNNKEVVPEGPDAVEHVADASLVAAKSENQGISSILNNEKSNVSDNHTGGPSDVSLISEVSLGVHDEITGINTSKNMDVLVEEPDPFEHIQSAGSVTSLVATKGESQGLASALNNKEVVPEGPDAVEHVADASLVAAKSENQVEHVADASLVAAKSENQGIASILNNEKVVAEGPATVEHVADDGLVAIKIENQVILNNDAHDIKSENQVIANSLNNEEVVAEGPVAVEHVAGDASVASESESIESALSNEEVVAEGCAAIEHQHDGLVVFKSENEVIVKNNTNGIESDHQRLVEVADEPNTVEHIAGDGLVAIKSETPVIVNNDTDVIKCEHKRIEEIEADEPDTVEHVADGGLVAMKSENQVIGNNGTVIIKSESQTVASSLNNKDFVAEGPDTVEDVPGDGLVAIEKEHQCVLNNDMAAGLAAIRSQKQVNMENEMDLDAIENIDIKAVGVTISENIRRCQTDLDVPSQMNEMNLEDDVNSDFGHTKIDHVEREYESTFRGAETMPQCQTGGEGRVDVKDDFNTPEKTNAKKNVCANQVDQLNNLVEEVSITPFSNKVESLMNKLAYLSLNTPEVAVRRMPFAVKNSSGGCLDFCEGAAQAVEKTDLDLPSMQIDHKENNNL